MDIDSAIICLTLKENYSFTEIEFFLQRLCWKISLLFEFIVILHKYMQAHIK